MDIPDTPFVNTLKTAFTERSSLPERCAISLGIEVNQSVYGDVVEIVTRNGGLDNLISRLRDSHPVDRPHLDEFDRQFWAVWNEAAAFAWAVDVARYQNVSFTDDRGTTDVVVADGPMIEAKTVDVSPEERRLMNRMAEASDREQLVMRGPSDLTQPHSNILKKFEDGLRDSLVKLLRQGGAELVVYFRLAGLDWPTGSRGASLEIQQWADEAALPTGARIVIWKGGDWREPFIDTDR